MLSTAFIIAFIVYFIKATTWKGMIFHGLCEMIGSWPEKIRKPLYECPICMTPWWGTLIYLVGHYLEIEGFEILNVQRVVFTVFVAGGINTIFLIINRIFDTLYTHDEEHHKTT